MSLQSRQVSAAGEPRSLMRAAEARISSWSVSVMVKVCPRFFARY